MTSWRRVVLSVDEDLMACDEVCMSPASVVYA